ncbi:MAG: nicotinate phosphoribosyltransferase [Clostridiales bacterium]|nr:nicotinate phosphoribosyltransferase [Clostridiales bacterium]
MNTESKNLLIDFYELTMGQGYFNKKVDNTMAYFDLFFRKVPDSGSFVIANGVKKCMEYLTNFHFSESDIDYLKSLNLFSNEYIERLKNIKFTGDVWAVEDGTVVFPNEPVITVKAPLLEAQLVETALLLYFNRASLIATKTNRIVRAANGRAVMEFGTRRAQGFEAAVDGALDAYIAGAVGTACTITGKKYGVPILGTMAHSFVQSFDTEYDAFKAYAQSFPDSCTLLVDTYNTLQSGLPNAIKVHNEVLKPMGKKLKGIRIDSGDLAYLTKEARKMLDEAGLEDTKICVSNSLDEYVIQSLLLQNAPIDSFGVGENLITAKSNPVFGGVYKLVAIEKDGKLIPKIKISDNVEKVTNPHFKKIYRLYDKNNGKFITDILTIFNEKAPRGKQILTHPDNPWTKKEVKDYEVVDLKVQMIENGKLIYNLPTIEETRENVKKNLATLWPEALRLTNPHTYTINLSDKLSQTKKDLLEHAGGQIEK